jgi:quinolinate synthase
VITATSPTAVISRKFLYKSFEKVVTVNTFALKAFVREIVASASAYMVFSWVKSSEAILSASHYVVGTVTKLYSEVRTAYQRWENRTTKG